MKVLRLDTFENSGDVEAEFNASPYTGMPTVVYVAVDVAFDAALLNDLSANARNSYYGLLNAHSFDGHAAFLDLAIDSGGTIGWNYAWGDIGSPANSPTLTLALSPLTWYHLKLHIDSTTNPVTVTASVNGNSIPTLSLSSGQTQDGLEFFDLFGNGNNTVGLHNYLYFRNCTVGSTLGASDIINDPLNTPPINTSIWNSGAFDAGIADFPSAAVTIIGRI